MEKKSKKTLTLIIISLVTLALGAIAVITSLRLREFSDVAVAPTAPISEPEAALLNDGCSESYSVDQSDCNGWCNDDDDCGLSSVDASSSATPIPYECLIAEGETEGICRNPNNPTSETCEEDLDLLVCNDECTEDSECGGGLVCDTDSDACRHPDYPENDNCQPDEELLVCNEDCEDDDECSGDLVCDTDTHTCRKYECLDETDCSCPDDPIVCNGTCEENNDCEGDLICDQPTSSCRNADCTGEQDCTCDIVTPTPTPTSTLTPSSTPAASATPEPSLPEAGNVVATSTLLMLGGVLLVLGAMSLLAL